jgi:hypothetical protein
MPSYEVYYRRYDFVDAILHVSAPSETEADAMACKRVADDPTLLRTTQNQPTCETREIAPMPAKTILEQLEFNVDTNLTGHVMLKHETAKALIKVAKIATHRPSCAVYREFVKSSFGNAAKCDCGYQAAIDELNGLLQ